MLYIDEGYVRTVHCPSPALNGAGEWEPFQVSAALEELKQQCAGAELIRLNGNESPPDDRELRVWPLCAAAAAIAPATLLLEGRDVLGPHQLVCTPFPIDAGGCDCGISVEVHELEHQAVALVYIDPVQFDYLRFDSIVAPPVTAGLPVLLRGTLPLPVAVSLALSYMPAAESIWVQEFTRSGRDVCVYSRRPGQLGRVSENQIPVIRRGSYE